MSIDPVSSIPSSVPSLTPITPVPPVRNQDTANDNETEKVSAKPPPGVGEKVDIKV